MHTTVIFYLLFMHKNVYGLSVRCIEKIKNRNHKRKEYILQNKKKSEYKRNIEVRKNENKQNIYIYIKKMSNNSFKVFYSFN